MVTTTNTGVLASPGWTPSPCCPLPAVRHHTRGVRCVRPEVPNAVGRGPKRWSLHPGNRTCGGGGEKGAKGASGPGGDVEVEALEVPAELAPEKLVRTS